MRVGAQYLLDNFTYHEYLKRLDARRVLEFYKAENCSEQANKDGTTEIVHSCLLDRVKPHHANGDQNASAACNIDKKTYVCYSMGYGCDLFHLIKKLEGKENFAEALTIIGGMLTGATMEGTDFKEQLGKVFEYSPRTMTLPHYFPSVLAKWLQPHDYWATRGVTPTTVEALQLGYDPEEHRVVFPHFFGEELVGWQKRVLPETAPPFPKYKNSWGFPKSDTLYNYDTASKHPRVCVVESPMSVAKAHSLGVPNVMATFGAKVSLQQSKLLRDFERVYLWFDRDPAGLNGERELASMLYRHTDVHVVIPDFNRDLADCDNLEEIARKIGGAVPAALRLGRYGRHHGREGKS
jgi:DNA primase